MGLGKAGFHDSEHTWQESGLNSGKLGQPDPAAQPPKCPECSSQRVWKDGLRHNPSNGVTVQRWLCRDCGFRFSEQNWSSSEILEHVPIVQMKPFYSDQALPSSRQVCELAEDPKNLASNIETRNEKAAGATKTPRDLAKVKGKIVEFAFWMNNEGYDEETANKRAFSIRRIVNLGADLWNPESVKNIIAKQRWKDSYKRNLTYAYETFLRMEGLTWNRPHYKREERYPFIPTETEIDQLIASCSKRVGTFLQGLKDTGADPGELAKLRWIDLNIESRTATITPVKGHNPRILPVSGQFIDRIARLPRKGEYIFNYICLQSDFYNQRKKAAHKLANPRIRGISLTTFRHWKATMEYHKTKDPYHVKKLLGHKSMQSTEIYINIEQAIFQTLDNEFHVKIAHNVEEATDLIKVGFDYVTGDYSDGGKIFRQRK